MSEVRLRQERPRGSWRLSGLVLSFLVVSTALLLRPVGSGSALPPPLVEVAGAVPNPGLHAVPTPSTHAAVRAAGGIATGHDEPLEPGARIHVQADGTVTIGTTEQPLLLALPVNLNQASAETLASLPGIGKETAVALVADRERVGPFRSVAGVARVRGVGRRTAEILGDFATVGEVPLPAERLPLDLNRASAPQLEQLPGIGPVTAARIVVAREDRGPFGALEELDDVRGIGPKTIERIRPFVRLEQP